jgi:phosphorylcholine metabolism protein LicD
MIKEKITYGLKIIDTILNAHNIYYTISYGTLLGAVRHWDMIPWDDDADITILRKDFHNVMALKDEFEKHGLIIEADWKLIKVYFDDTKFPFIDIFIHDEENGNIVRCCKPFDSNCNYIDETNEWWWKWVKYPSAWILERKRYRFGEIEVWGPKQAEKVLKYWYGPDCLTKCQSAILDHVTGEPIQAKDIGCGELPKPQL